MTVEHYIAGAPAMGDAVRLGFTRPDNGFKEVLSKVAEKTPGAKNLASQSSLTRM